VTALLCAPYDANMPRRQFPLAALFTALVIALLTSCTTTQDAQEQRAALPDGARLLSDSATAMRTVTTTHFIVDVQGNAPEIPFQSADGRLTREGSAKGIVKRNQGGRIVELEIVVVGDQLYLRGATGPFLKLQASTLSAFYDPRQILNPDRGIASVIASGQGATTEAREQVNGVDSYRLRVTFPAQPLSTLIPGPAQDRTGQIWVAVAGSHLVQAQFPTANGTITIRFSEFDTPVEITAPA